jgi:8-oxo-dGTP diphosphatase
MGWACAGYGLATDCLWTGCGQCRDPIGSAWHSDRVHSPPVIVVGAAIIADGLLLAAQRSEPAQLAGGWELPGGKVEPGESDVDALVRECREELGVEIAVGDRVGGDWPLGKGAVLRVWTARVLEGEPQPLEDHMALRWLSRGELYGVAWLPADLPVIAAIEAWLDDRRVR